jgi:hypothetical protein
MVRLDFGSMKCSAAEPSVFCLVAPAARLVDDFLSSHARRNHANAHLAGMPSPKQPVCGLDRTSRAPRGIASAAQ